MLSFNESSKIFASEDAFLNYMKQMNIFSAIKKCYKCKKCMNLLLGKRIWRCTIKKCRHEVSIFKNTPFYNSKISINIIFNIFMLCFNKMPIKGILNITKCSTKTITKYSKILRELITEMHSSYNTKIGGQGIIVELDETKLGKRKYHRGHRVEGVWCIAGIERTPEKKCFVVPVIRRDEKTIKKIIEEYIMPESIIYTDGWKAYKNPCNELGFNHMTVNHSLYFKDPVTSVHTNTVEGLNNAIKTFIRPRNRVLIGIDEYLKMFQFCRDNKKSPFEVFMQRLNKIF